MRTNENIDFLIKHTDKVRFIKEQRILRTGHIVRMDKGRQNESEGGDQFQYEGLADRG